MIGLVLAGCGSSSTQQSSQATSELTTTAGAWTRAYTLTRTFTSTSSYTPTSTHTPTVSNTPTITSTFTISPTPTYVFPKVRVNVENLHCQYGPNKAYLHAQDLHEGNTGVVWGRDIFNTWLFVKMDNLDKPCWVHKAYVDIEGDYTQLLVQQTRLPITNALYDPPANVWAERDGNQVIVTWDEVYMTEDDDRGYFLEVWVCQGGSLFWVPASQPNQYENQYTFTDEQGCSLPSYGEIRTVEKHGNTDAVSIPWPP